MGYIEFVFLGFIVLLMKGIVNLFSVDIFGHLFITFAFKPFGFK